MEAKLAALLKDYRENGAAMPTYAQLAELCGEPFDYIEQAHVTCSDKFYGGRVGFEHFELAMKRAIRALESLDIIKKSLFYGKGIPDDVTEDCSGIEDYIAFNAANGQHIIHGIIGIATEAGELLELLYNSVIDGKSFDIVNLQEECGDVFWYQAILAKAADFTFDECQRKNIAKLRSRFGEKFSEYDANNRNLDAERAILEQQMQPELNFKG